MMHHKIKLLLSLVLISLAAAHAKRVEDTSSSGPQAKSETIKFGVKMKPRKDLGAHHCFWEWKLSRAVGIQVGVNPFSVGRNQFSWDPFNNLGWSNFKQNYTVSFDSTKPPILDLISLRIYPDKYKKLCISVSYIKKEISSAADLATATDEAQGSYWPVLGIDYEFDWGLILTFSTDKIPSILQWEIMQLPWELSIGFNLAPLFW